MVDLAWGGASLPKNGKFKQGLKSCSHLPLHPHGVFTSSMPPERPNTRPGRKASKRGRPTADPSSQALRTPAEMSTAPIVDDRLQSAIDATIEGILPRIVHKVSTLLGGEGISQEVTTRSGGQTAHWLRRTGRWTGGLRHRTQTLPCLAHWRGGGGPQHRLLTTQWSVHKAKGYYPGGSYGQAQNQLGRPGATLTRVTRFGLMRDHTPPKLQGPPPSGRFQQPPTANMRTSGRGTRDHGRETGQVQLIVGDGKQPMPNP